MKPQIVPYHSGSHEIKFIHDTMVRSKILYNTVLFSVFVFLFLLPVIRVTVSVQGRGIVRPLTEVTEIRVIPAAPVASVCVSEGRSVAQGDTLLLLESVGVRSKIEFITKELQETKDYIIDLQNLNGIEEVKYFHSDLYRSQHGNFSRKLAEINFRIERAHGEVARQQPLYENHLISEKEYEELVNCGAQLENEKKVMEAFQKLQWRSELDRYCSSRDSYVSQLDQLQKELQLHVIKSPVNGTVESFAGIYPGCNLQSGQVVAVISPDNSLIAELYVPAGKIGLLSGGMPVRIQIDAFNYNEWGMVTGHITRISEDYMLVNNVPAFKVQCSLDSMVLRLKNGTPGRIKKGMTMNVRFIVARRSLFQLLYQKTDDWLNPSRNAAGMNPFTGIRYNQPL
jgi:membrane fusion protein, peptide pheromone/bacteriocin exporter